MVVVSGSADKVTAGTGVGMGRHKSTGAIASLPLDGMIGFT